MQAVADQNLDEYYEQALNLIVSGRARDAFDLQEETAQVRDRYGRNTFGQSCLLARRLVEAGTRVVEVIWPKVANSDNHSWDHHVGLTERMKNQSGPMLDTGLSALIEDLDQRGLLDETLVLAVGEFGRSPQKGVSTSGNGNSADGRDHWPYCYTAVIAGAGIKRGCVHGKSRQDRLRAAGRSGAPAQLLATIYHAFGIDPETIVYNHLNQPRELVKATPSPGSLPEPRPKCSENSTTNSSDRYEGRRLTALINSRVWTRLPRSSAASRILARLVATQTGDGGPSVHLSLDHRSGSRRRTMPIETICQTCARKLRVADEYAGKKARCPQCGTIYVVPGAADAVSSGWRKRSTRSSRTAVETWQVRTPDGRVYGPVPKSELDQWVIEGRIPGRSRAAV